LFGTEDGAGFLLLNAAIEYSGFESTALAKI